MITSLPMSATKKRKNIDGSSGPATEAELVAQCTTTFNMLYATDARKHQKVIRVLLTNGLISKDRLNELMGYDVDQVPERHFYAKLEDPSYDVPPSGVPTEEILWKGGMSGYCLGFFIHHVAEDGFTHRPMPIQGAQLRELLDHINELGASIEDIWSVYPYTYKSR